ncbi:MAG: filamentous hemagglutinin N-terminal domain-containing protein, partial [Luteimonas sp.]
MNRIYSLVFNRAIGRMQVASELVRRRGAAGAAATACPAPVPALLALLLAVATGSVWAQVAPDPTQLPTGEVVGGGIADISREGLTLLIQQNLDRGLITWDTFDIGKDAGVRIEQPSANAALLNYIRDSDASQIFGRIDSNGAVFLMNRNGLHVASGASINVGSLVASSLVMQDPADFLDPAAQYGLTLSNTPTAPGMVINQGTISATHDVHLIGGAVSNS